MNKTLAGILALLGVVGATALTTFVIIPAMRDADSPEPNAAVTSTEAETSTDAAAEPETAAEGTEMASVPAADEKSDKPNDGSENAAVEETSEAATSVDPTASWAVPAFDVLRVEPDGSTVIAGRAEPGTILEVLDGETVIATTEVGQSGDFVAILDNPLSPGDHQLALRAQGSEGLSKLSEEIATIAIPDGAIGELLAMVTKPGEPSRIITAPTAQPVETAQAETTEPEPATTEDVAEAGTSETAEASGEAAEPASDASEVVANAAEEKSTETETASQSVETSASETAVPVEDQTSAATDAASEDAAADATQVAASDTAGDAKEEANAEDTAASDSQATEAQPSDAPAADQGSGAATETAAADATTEGSATETAAGEGATSEATSEVAASDETETSGSELAASETAEVGAQSSGSQTATAEATTAAGDETEQATVAAGESQPAAETEVAAAATEPAETEKPAAPAIDLNVRVEAVEIEDDMLFVAGSATPGMVVRVYADDQFIGDSPVSREGRFVVEAQTELAVGEHIITVDLLKTNSAEVQMRAAVPFLRPEGTQIAAVATPQNSDEAPASDASEAVTTTSNAETTPTAAPEGTVAVTIADVAKLEEEASAALSELATLSKADKIPATAALLAARIKAAEKLKSLSEMTIPETASDTQKKAMMAMRDKAIAALSAMAKLPVIEEGQAIGPDIMAAMNEALSEANDAMAAPAAAAMASADEADGKTEPAKSDEPTATSETAAVADATPNPETDAAKPLMPASTEQMKSEAPSEKTARNVEVAEAKPVVPTIIQDPLTSTDGSVIIRRGDTLWQISRRVYGRGVRYTTIYLANQQQIRNPDRITPGQIFMVPETAMDIKTAEETHRDRVTNRN